MNNCKLPDIPLKLRSNPLLQQLKPIKLFPNKIHFDVMHRKFQWHQSQQLYWRNKTRILWTLIHMSLVVAALLLPAKKDIKLEFLKPYNHNHFKMFLYVLYINNFTFYIRAKLCQRSNVVIILFYIKLRFPFTSNFLGMPSNTWASESSLSCKNRQKQQRQKNQ